MRGWEEKLFCAGTSVNYTHTVSEIKRDPLNQDARVLLGSGWPHSSWYKWWGSDRTWGLWNLRIPFSMGRNAVLTYKDRGEIFSFTFNFTKSFTKDAWLGGHCHPLINLLMFFLTYLSLSHLVHLVQNMLKEFLSVCNDHFGKDNIIQALYYRISNLGPSSKKLHKGKFGTFLGPFLYPFGTFSRY